MNQVKDSNETIRFLFYWTVSTCMRHIYILNMNKS
jgi:hypothetical protein